MENCTLYSHHLGLDKIIEIIKTELPKAKIESKDNGLQKALLVILKGGLFGKDKTLKINYRQRLNPSYKLERVECELTQNLAGMLNFVKSLPSQNEEIRGRFLYKIMATNCEISVIGEPDFKGFDQVLLKIAHALDAFIFAQPGELFNKSSGQYFADKNGEVIIDADGNCGVATLEVNVDAKYHDQPDSEVTAEQLELKARSEAYLESNGIKINKDLPCVVSSNDVKIRDVKEIIERAYALLIITAKADGILQEDMEKEIENKSICGFSPWESAAFYAGELSEQDKLNATWRYESLYVMLWTLGKTESLTYPSDVCDVSSVIEWIFAPTREAFEASVVLKSAAQIVEELDRIYRMNWACVDARIKGQEVSGNINPGVVYERHYSLNWLTNYQGQDWDDVKTNT